MARNGCEIAQLLNNLHTGLELLVRSPQGCTIWVSDAAAPLSDTDKRALLLLRRRSADDSALQARPIDLSVARTDREQVIERAAWDRQQRSRRARSNRHRRVTLLVVEISHHRSLAVLIAS